MNKKSKSRKYGKSRRRGIPLKAILFGLAGVLILTMALLVFRKDNSGEIQANSGGTPALSVDQKSIDMGDVQDFTVKTISIKVTNTGSGTLRFTEKPYIQVLQGCCPPALSIGKMTLAPGESTTVRSVEFFMHPGMDGPHNFAVHLITNDSTQPDLVVNVLSDWYQ